MLEVKNLKTEFRTEEGTFLAVNDVSFSLTHGRTLGIVGESGCGKSVTSLSLLRLIQRPGEIVGGEIIFEGRNLLNLREEEMRKVRGREIAMIFQEPMTSLNPVVTIGNQMDETIRLHNPGMSSAEVKARSLEMLKLVNIPAPEIRYHEYPHQLSGGMRQRVVIAMALSCHPKLLIADEPTTALDVTIQAQILDLLKKVKNEFGTSMILITHDLGVVAEMCDEVIVMYAGRVVEQGTVEDIFYRPQHPYTKGLLDSIPRFHGGQKLKRLRAIPGIVPSLRDRQSGCQFFERCSYRRESCSSAIPQLIQVAPTQKVSCHSPLGVSEVL